MLADEVPVHANLLCNKLDLRVAGRLTRLLVSRRADAVVTVGAGDKMFWGRLAAWRAGVPVVLSALHSTGWPDGVGRLNRLLTPMTDGFIGVASAHGKHLVEREGFPAEKVHVIPNGVDVDRFAQVDRPESIRRELGIDDRADGRHRGCAAAGKKPRVVSRGRCARAPHLSGGAFSDRGRRPAAGRLNRWRMRWASRAAYIFWETDRTCRACWPRSMSLC